MKDWDAQSHTAQLISIYQVYEIKYPKYSIDNHQEHQTSRSRCDYFVLLSSHWDLTQIKYEYQNKMVEYIVNCLNEYQHQIWKIHFLVMVIITYTEGKFHQINIGLDTSHFMDSMHSLTIKWCHALKMYIWESFYGYHFTNQSIRNMDTKIFFPVWNLRFIQAIITIFLLTVFWCLLHICIWSLWLDRETNWSQQHVTFLTFNVRLPEWHCC